MSETPLKLGVPESVELIKRVPRSVRAVGWAHERTRKRPLLRGLTDGQMTSRCGGNGPRGSGSPREEERDYFA